MSLPFEPFELSYDISELGVLKLKDIFNKTNFYTNKELLEFQTSNHFNVNRLALYKEYNNSINNNSINKNINNSNVDKNNNSNDNKIDLVNINSSLDSLNILKYKTNLNIFKILRIELLKKMKNATIEQLIYLLNIYFKYYNIDELRIIILNICSILKENIPNQYYIKLSDINIFSKISDEFITLKQLIWINNIEFYKVSFKSIILSYISEYEIPDYSISNPILKISEFNNKYIISLYNMIGKNELLYSTLISYISYSFFSGKLPDSDENIPVHMLRSALSTLRFELLMKFHIESVSSITSTDSFYNITRIFESSIRESHISIRKLEGLQNEFRSEIKGLRLLLANPTIQYLLLKAILTQLDLEINTVAEDSSVKLPRNDQVLCLFHELYCVSFGLKQNYNYLTTFYPMLLEVKMNFKLGFEVEVYYQWDDFIKKELCRTLLFKILIEFLKFNDSAAMFPFVSLIIHSCNQATESNYVIQILTLLFQHPVDEDFLGLVIDIVEPVTNMPNVVNYLAKSNIPDEYKSMFLLNMELTDQNNADI